VSLLTPAALRSAVCHDEKVALAGSSGLRAHPRLLLLASHIAGIAPLFGFTAITLAWLGMSLPFSNGVLSSPSCGQSCFWERAKSESACWEPP
jgi:hypothetical protein